MNKKRKGVTLVELIIALFIIALVVASIVPMMIIGYRQIIISGKKNVSVYTTQKKVEDVLAGNTNTYTDVEIVSSAPSTLNLSFNGVTGVTYVVNGSKMDIRYTGEPPFNIKTFKPN